MVQKPLQGMVVLDFSQFLSGPYAGLRLADLGARVIKIERPDGGDLCRRLYISNLELDGDSTLFHSINRNKESFSVNLKDENDRQTVIELLKKADVMIQNYRPGIIEKLGYSYNEVKAINPGIIYGSISGYGTEGPLVNKPGQDLLVQSFTGLPGLSGNAGHAPLPFGLAIADMMTGAHLVQGILAAAVRRAITGKGALIEVSLLESTLDAMQEVWCNALQDEDNKLQRSAANQAHVSEPPPYGIYATQDGYIAMGAVPVPTLGRLIGCRQLEQYSEPSSWLEAGDEIKRILQEHLLQKPAAHWTAILEPEDIPYAEVTDWRRLIQHEGFQSLGMVQEVIRPNGAKLSALRCPIRVDGERFTSPAGSPQIGEHNEAILAEFVNNSNYA
jgi:CoA:oxalate CoA-transferase